MHILAIAAVALAVFIAGLVFGLLILGKRDDKIIEECHHYDPHSFEWPDGKL